MIGLMRLLINSCAVWTR